MQTNVTKATAIKVLEVVDAGLVSGLGRPIPGEMCVEAAVCFAMGLPHSDEPSCVSRALRSLKITLNDANWSSNASRAAGMRRLAVAQLGSAGVLDDKEFARRVTEIAIRVSVPLALRAAASLQKDAHHKGALLDAALRCKKEGTHAASYAARAASDAASDAASYAARAASYAARAASDAASYAASYAASDKTLAEFAEAIVQVLIEMKAPGCEWLALTEKPTKRKRA